MNTKPQKFNRRKEDNHWVFDRRIPLGVMCMIVVQTVVLIWWLAQRDAAITENTERISMLEKDQKTYIELLIRIDERLKVAFDGRGERRADVGTGALRN